MIKRAEVREEYVEEQRRGIKEALRNKVSKRKIMEMIAISTECEKTGSRKGIQSLAGLEDKNRGGGMKSREKRSGQQKVDGSKIVLTRKDGQMWLLPHEVVGELTWRKDKRRRLQMALWEAPPPGPPGGLTEVMV